MADEPEQIHSVLPIEVDPDDATQDVGELHLEKDELTRRAGIRARRESAMAASSLAEEGVQPKGAEPDGSVQGESAEAENKPPTQTSPLRHVSAIEAVGGAAETLNDLVETSRDLGVSLSKLLGASDEQIAEAIALSPKQGPAAVAEVLSEIGDPDSGSFIRGLANFATGFVGAGKLKPVQALAAKGPKGVVLANALRGALSDFVTVNPEMGNLSDMAEGTFADSLLDPLQTKEDDSDTTSRMKKTVEGAALGELTGGLVKLAKFGRAFQQSGRKIKGAQEVFEEIDSAVTLQRRNMVDALGDPEAPRISRVTEGGEPGGVKINWARIDGDDDLKQVMRELADSRSDSIADAQRGVKTHAQTKMEAGEIDAFGLLEAEGTRLGRTMNAAESFSLRELWVASSRKMHELSAVVSSGDSTVSDKIAFRRMLAVHNTIQEQVLAVRTETARALNQWRIPAGDTLEFSSRFDEMAQVLEQDVRGTEKIAKYITQLKNEGKDAAADSMVYGSRWAKTSAAATQLYYASLLSSPHTHARNIYSNTLMLGVTVGERKAANLLGKSFGNAHVADGETSAMVHGMAQGFRDAFRINAYNAGRAVAARRLSKAGDPIAAREILDETGDELGTFYKALVSGDSGFGVNKVETARIGALSPEALQLDKGNPLRRVSSFFDTLSTMPTRSLSAGDEIFKTINQRMELHAQAVRTARSEVVSGRIPESEYLDRVTDLTNNPDESMQLMARQFAERNTFTETPADTKMWKAFQAVSKVPFFGKLTLPFVRTPYNLNVQAYQRVPALGAITRQWREDLLAGGARADLAITKQLMGGAALMTLGDMALRMDITGDGPVDFKEREQLRRAGWQPNSIRWTGEDGKSRYFSYRGLEPISTMLGLAANTTEIIASADFEDEDKEIDDLVIATSMAVMSQVTSANYMSGISSLIEAQSDPRRYGESYFERLVSPAVPTGVALANRVAFDNVFREVNGMGEKIRSRVPGLSQELPAKRDKWAREIKFGSGLGSMYDALVPSNSSVFDPIPIDAELIRLDTHLGKMKRKVSFVTEGGDRASVNLAHFPKAYDMMIRFAGNEMTESVHGLPVSPWGTGKGLKDELNDLVTGAHPMSDYYENELTDGPDGGKADFIKDIVGTYQDAAKEHVVREFPEIADVVERKVGKQTPKLKAFEGLNLK